jgi:acyl carrier protein
VKTVKEGVTDIIRRAVMENVSEIRPETKLSELGMDSLEQIECVLSLEEAFKVELNESAMWKLRTVQEVIEAVNQAVAAAR